MSFVQVIDCRTDRYPELKALDAEWEASVAGQHRVRRQIVARDRNDPRHHVMFVFFDSAEDAAYNSELPGTQEGAGKWAALMDGPPTFLDLDILEERTYR